MAANENLLKGEIAENGTPSDDKDVEKLLMGFLKALIEEQSK